MMKPFKRALIYAKLQLKFYAKKYTTKQDLNCDAQNDQEKVIDGTGGSCFAFSNRASNY